MAFHVVLRVIKRSFTRYNTISEMLFDTLSLHSTTIEWVRINAKSSIETNYRNYHNFIHIFE